MYRCRCHCPDYRTHVTGVNIGSLPTQPTYTDKKWELDAAAYKAMRADGLQPPRVDGAYVMERSAKNEREISMGRPLDADTHAVFDEAGL